MNTSNLGSSLPLAAHNMNSSLNKKLIRTSQGGVARKLLLFSLKYPSNYLSKIFGSHPLFNYLCLDSSHVTCIAIESLL